MVLTGPMGRGWLKWFLRLQMGKRLEGGQKIEKEMTLGPLSPNPFEARDRSTGLLSHRRETSVLKDSKEK